MPDKTKQSIHLTIKNGIIESCELYHPLTKSYERDGFFHPASGAFEYKWQITKDGNYAEEATYYDNDEKTSFGKKNAIRTADYLTERVSGFVEYNHGYVYINGKEVTYLELVKQLEKSAELVKATNSIGLNNSGVTQSSNSFTNIASNNINKTTEIS